MNKNELIKQIDKSERHLAESVHALISRAITDEELYQE